MQTLRIIFMGTPEFAVPSLQILIDNKYEVVAVVTAPDKPQGRGQKIVYSPVKECALQHMVPYCTNEPKSLNALNELKIYQAIFSYWRFSDF